MRAINQEVAGRYLRGRGIEGQTIATFRGCEIRYTSKAASDSIIAATRLHTARLAFDLRTRANTPGAVAIDQIEEAIGDLTARLSSRRESLEHYERVVVVTEPAIGRAFPFEGELAGKREELEALDASLADDRTGVAA